MPRLENIERFKEILYTLGSEPEINAQRSVAREDDVSPAPGEASAGAPGLEESPDLGLDAEAGMDVDELPALGVDDLLGAGQEAAEPPGRGAGEPPSDAPGETAEAGAGFDAEAGGAGLDTFDFGDLLGAGEERAETSAESEEAVAAEEPADEGEVGDLGLANGFFMPDLGLADGEAAEEPAEELSLPEQDVSAPVPEGVEGAGEESAPSADDLTFPEAEVAPAADAGTGENDLGSFDLGSADLGSLDFGEPEAADATAVPGGGDESLGEVPAGEAADTEAEAGALADAGGFDPFAVDFGSPEGSTEASTGQASEEGDVAAEALGSPETGVAPEATEGGQGALADDQSLDMESFDTAGFGEALSEAAPAAGGAETPAGLDESIDGLAESFSLEGLSDGVEEGAVAAGEAPVAADAGEAAAGEAPAEGAAEVSLQDREFRALQRNLATLPRNLKVAIESLIGEQGYTGDGLRPLLDMLVRGAPPRDIAAAVGKITGRTIKIPVRFEKQTGAALEEETRSFAYIFRKNVLPILRTILLVGALLGLLVVGGYMLVYIPLHAEATYRAGYRAIEQSRFADAGRSFDQAVEIRRVKSWYYRFAEGYAAKKQYPLADDMYARLTGAYGYDKKGLLDRARLQSDKLGNYAVAEGYLNQIVEKDLNDYDAVLAVGDVYLTWATVAPEKAAKEGERTRKTLLEQARLSFARLLEKYGYKNPILFRMMTYFVRSDSLGDAQDLRAYFEADPEFNPDPDVYAELGGYLIDKGDIEGARTVLLKAAKASTTVPEIDYNLARLYRITDDPAEEGKALGNAVVTLGEAEQTPPRIFMQIDTHRRYGEWYYRQKQYIDATKQFGTAIAEVETALQSRILEPRAELGLAYQGLGDVRYYVESDYPAALPLYSRARELGVRDASLDYRVGYIHYAEGDFPDAIVEFVPVQEKLPQSWNALFGLATALYQRGDYFAAEGYYRHLLDRLTDKRNGIVDLKPETNPDHFTIVNLLTKAHNNLGVTYYMQGRSGSSRGRAVTRALVEVTEAAQYLDVLARNPETLERSEAKNLAYLNAAGIQHPAGGFEPTIYDRIPKDPSADRF